MQTAANSEQKQLLDEFNWTFGISVNIQTFVTSKQTKVFLRFEMIFKLYKILAKKAALSF